MLPLPEVIRHVRRQRRMLGLSQTRLAQDADTSQSFIAKLEQGRLNPSYEAVRQVMEALEAHVRKEEPEAAELMHKEAVFVRPGDDVATALSTMKKRGISQLPVLEGGQPIGGLSEAHVLEWLERGEDLDSLKRRPVADIMHSGFPTVDPGTRRRVLVELLRDQPLVLVVDGGKLKGVIAKSDLW